MAIIKLNMDNIVFMSLDKSYLNELLLMQEEVFLTLKDSEILRRNDKKMFERCLMKPNEVIGAFYQKHLIAFGILFYGGMTKENLAYDLNKNVDINCVANIKLIIVREDYRGNGLQCKLISLLEIEAINNNMKTLCATVSPLNKYSLINFVKSGYKAIKEYKKYDGLSRVLLEKSIGCNC